MILIRLILIVGLFLPVQLTAQTITAKLRLNPVHLEEYLPLSAGAAVEIGVSTKSSLQMSGLYRVDKQLSQGVDRGPKFYLDYRYYPHPVQQKNSGFYVSPFLGYGRLVLAEGDEPTGEVASQRMRETVAGLLVGYQPYKRSWFSIDLYAGPEYQWRTKQVNYYDGRVYQSFPNRVWFRAGLSVCARLKK